MAREPRVSICIPAYENPEGVRRLLLSVRAQRFSDYEVIVTDDSASDDVEKAVREVFAQWKKAAPVGRGAAENDRFLFYYRNTPPRGAVANWNAAVERARGEYVKLMHHDDWLTDAESLGALVRLLDDHPDCDLAFCGTRQVELAGAASEQAGNSPEAGGMAGNAPATQTGDMAEAGAASAQADNTPEAGGMAENAETAGIASAQPDVQGTARAIADADLALLRQDWRNLFLGNTIGAPSAVIVRRSALAGNAADGASPAADSTAPRGVFPAAERAVFPDFDGTGYPLIHYDEKLTWLVDGDYYMQLFSRNPHFACTKAPLVSIGLSGGQLTERCRNDEALIRGETVYLYRKYRLWEVPVVEQTARGRRTVGQPAESTKNPAMCGTCGDGGGNPYRQKLLTVLAQTHTRAAELPTELGISADSPDWRAAKRAEAAAARKRRADTVRYLADKARRRLTEHLTPLEQAAARAGKALARPTAALFYLALTIELLIVLMDKSDYLFPYEGLTFRLTFLLFACRMACSRFSKKELLWLLAFLALGLVSWRVSGRNEILRMTVFVAACRTMPVKRVMKYVFWFTAAGCLALGLLSAAGVFGTVSLTQDFGRGMETRYALGFGHPNALHCMALMVTALGLYLYEKRLRWPAYAALFAANLWLYLLTRSNTGFAMTALVILACAAVNPQLFAGKKGAAQALRSATADSGKQAGTAGSGSARAGKRAAGRGGRCSLGAALSAARWPYLLGEAVVAACIVFSVLAAIFGYEIPIFAKLDGAVNGRIASLWDSTFHDGTLSTWSLFSTPVNDNFFDMGFVRLIYWYGVIPAAALLGVLFALLRAVRRKRDAAALVMVVVFSIYTVVEAHLVSEYLLRNYLLLLTALYAPVIFGGQAEQEAAGRAG